MALAPVSTFAARPEFPFVNEALSPSSLQPFFSLIFGFLPSRLLEEIAVQELIGKKIGYYAGSFDPLHKGHEELIEKALQWVDRVILYPVPGGDSLKLNRSPFEVRMEMVKSVYHSHPKVLLTYLTPFQLQQKLLNPILTGQIQWTALFGSDIVIDHWNNPDRVKKQKAEERFMQGIVLPEEHRTTTLGAIWALKASAFLIFRRAEDGLTLAKFEDGMFAGRLVTALLTPSDAVIAISSTKVKKAVKAGALIEEITESVSPPVAALIAANNLYK